ncbi:uncharacterized protein LOC112494815 [Cephus cinctus]|uniref:Uncharacterized protein LOC112494815 n=1 Tax=Cephus cinctus TaxID=211228 RepID=A0AAJ7RNM2_CEPCN|nr:uncharacterized protein LOC112494815 [Cephus cinctus]
MVVEFIKIQYYSFTEFSLNLRQILALEFVPVGHVIVKFQELMECVRTDMVRRRLPVIKLEHWNQYEATLNDLPRTNNSVEGWHRAFSSIISAVHANIWKFIDAFKKEENLSSIKLSQLIGGQKTATNKKT